jgi:hypothetical protein
MLSWGRLSSLPHKKTGHPRKEGEFPLAGISPLNIIEPLCYGPESEKCVQEVPCDRVGS